MRRRILPAVAGLGVVLGLACMGDDDDTAGSASTADTRIQLDCLGMSQGVPLAGTMLWRTRSWDRCVLFTSDTIPGDRIDIVTGEAAVYPGPGQGTLLVQQGDITWVAQEGSIELTDNEGDKGAGTFTVLATSGDIDGVAEITGQFDWCAMGLRTDCPHASNGGLEKAVSVQFSDWRERPDTYASECRVLIDPATQGVQVDLQIGVFNGVNVGLWGNQCEAPYVTPGTFSFRSGGVSGPGTYGPHTSRIGFVNGATEAIHLPELQYTAPLVWYGWSCLSYGDAVQVFSQASETLDPTECTWTIDESPGKFTLDCENTWLRAGRTDAASQDNAFHLEADCDVRYAE